MATDMLTKVRPLNMEARNNILAALRSEAANMISRFSPSIDEVELYRYLICKEQFGIMFEASQLMPKTSYSLDFWTPTVIDSELSIRVQYNLIKYPSGEITQWLWPKYLNFISYNTEFGDKIIPIVTIARRWQTTIRLVDLMFTYHKPAIVLNLMPWLRNFIENMQKTYEWRSEYLRILTAPQPRDVPGRSRWLNYFLLDGGSLLAQYTLIKDVKRDIKPNEVVLSPSLREDLIHVELRNQFNDFSMNCHNMGIPTMYPKLGGGY